MSTKDEKLTVEQLERGLEIMRKVALLYTKEINSTDDDDYKGTLQNLRNYAVDEFEAIKVSLEEQGSPVKGDKAIIKFK